MGKEVTTLSICVRLPEERKKAQEEQRKVFWDWIRKHGHEHYREQSSATFEAELRRSFGRNLQHLLVMHFHNGWLGPMKRFRDEPALSVSIPDTAKILPLILFEVRELSYGSLEMGIAVVGAKHLAKLFDYDFDIFMTFLRTYVPAAFKTSIGGQSPHVSAYEVIANELSFDVAAARGLRQSFERSPDTAPESPGLSTPTKAHVVTSCSVKQTK